MGCHLLPASHAKTTHQRPHQLLAWRSPQMAWDPYQPFAKRTPHRFPLRPSLPVLENGTAYTRDFPYKPSDYYYPPPPPHRCRVLAAWLQQGSRIKIQFVLH